MSLKDIYTCSYYKKLRPKFAFAAVFSCARAAGIRQTHITLFPKVTSLHASSTLGVQCFIFAFFQHLAVWEQMERGQNGGKRWKYIQWCEQTGQELDLLQTNYGTFDICAAILVRFRDLSWRTWLSVVQTRWKHTNTRWGKDLPLNGGFHLVILCHPHHNGKHKQTPIFIYPPLVSNLGVGLSGRNTPWAGLLSISRQILTQIVRLKVQSWTWAVGALRVLQQPWHRKKVCVMITIVLLSDI